MTNKFGYGMGYELEAYGFKLKHAQELLPKCDIHLDRSTAYLDYSGYNVLNEIGITDKLLCGGEIVSPILYNEEELIKSINLVLDVLRETDGYDCTKRNSSAGLHFHFGIEVLENNKDYFIRLIKFLKAFEGEIYNHSRAEGEDLRKCIGTFARPYTMEDFKQILEHFENNDPNYIILINQLSIKKYMFRIAAETIEFRTCNNPLQDLPFVSKTDLFDKEKSIEQFLIYFHMWQRILEYIKSDEYEKDRIDLYSGLSRSNPYSPIPERERVFTRILSK